MLGNLLGALRTGGPAALYCCFIPFCAKSLPFDATELVTYATLRELRAEAAAPSTPAVARAAAAAVPEEAWDLAFGAAAGAAHLAVLISMPCDCIQTVMETSAHAVHAPAAAGRGAGSAAAGVAAFIATGRRLVAAQGPAALLRGMGPRLAEKVPGTMFYWYAVEAARRALQPLTIAS